MPARELVGISKQTITVKVVGEKQTTTCSFPKRNGNEIVCLDMPIKRKGIEKGETDMAENRYPNFVMETLRKGLGLEADDTSRDSEINTFSPSEAFEGMLNWEGIIGYAETIKYWIENIYGIDLNNIPTETEIDKDKVEIDRKEVFNYFKNLISSKETWEINQVTNGTTVTMLNGALTFAQAFGLITNDEYNELFTIEIPTTEPYEFTCNDCPYFYADEEDEPASCHYQGEDRYAPCSYEEPEEVDWGEYFYNEYL